MRRLLARLGRPASFALLPLSVIPFLLALPVIAGSHESFKRVYQSGPLPAPLETISNARLARFKALPATPAAVPVLAYGAVNDSGERESVTRRQFADQLRLLRHLGYETISMDQYARL